MQNTMVEGGGGKYGRWGKKMKNEEVGDKNEKGERKRDENWNKNGGKGLKNAFF